MILIWCTYITIVRDETHGRKNCKSVLNMYVEAYVVFHKKKTFITICASYNIPDKFNCQLEVQCNIISVASYCIGVELSARA